MNFVYLLPMNSKQLVNAQFICRIIALMTLLGMVQESGAQAYFVPKVGLKMPLADPSIGPYLVDNKQGAMAGVELRSGRRSICFNPGLMVYHHRIFLFEKVAGADESPVHETHVTWIKTRLGVQANVSGNGLGSMVHLRGALSPVFALEDPDLEGFDLVDENYRWGYMEFHLGTGIDLGRVVVDVDYQLSLVRNIHTSDIVENNVTLQLGILLF